MARKKRKTEEEHENLERWLVSYADFITLLFAFFVTMYAISRVDQAKFGSMVESLQRALGSVTMAQMAQKETGAFTTYSKPIDVSISPLVPQKGQNEKENLENLAKEIQDKMEGMAQSGAAQGEVSLKQISYFIDKRGLILRFSERFFFDSGEASIREEAIPLINILGESLASIPNQIRIEGHTDSVPINTPQFPSNWELSTARATTLVHYFLTQSKFDPNRLSAAGYGEFRSIASNNNSQGRALNRRVDVVILGSKETEKEPQAPDSPVSNRSL
jgi:chemotaxis protein MotB